MVVASRSVLRWFSVTGVIDRPLAQATSGWPGAARAPCAEAWYWVMPRRRRPSPPRCPVIIRDTTRRTVPPEPRPPPRPQPARRSTPHKPAPRRCISCGSDPTEDTDLPLPKIGNEQGMQRASGGVPEAAAREPPRPRTNTVTGKAGSWSVGNRQLGLAGGLPGRGSFHGRSCGGPGPRPSERS